MITFEGRTALITGAAGGMGAATAKLLYDAGAKLVLTDLDAAAATQVARGLDPAGERTLACALDIADHAACISVFAQAAARFGRIDAVINTAGIYVFRESLFADLGETQWRRMLSVNLDGCYNVCQAAVPHLAQGSAIVLVSSVAAHRGSHMHSSYAAAKAGVLGLMRSLALELAPHTRVNAISPGLIDTPMAQPMVAQRGEQVRAAIPLQRFGSAAEAAGVIAFLCSDLASYVTGETLHVNGGMVMM